MLHIKGKNQGHSPSMLKGQSYLQTRFLIIDSD